VSDHDTGGMPSHDQIHIGPKSGWRRMPAAFALMGVAGLAVGFTTMGAHPADFWFSYLVALMFWLVPGLGGLFFVLVQHATRAGWSTVVRRIAENALLTLPVTGLLALPLVLWGAHDVYHWTHLEDPAVMSDPILAAKRPWLNEGFFQVRTLIYIGVWGLLAYLYWGWSTKQDTARDPIALTHKLRWTAPIGVLLFAFTLTFGAFDYLMSLDPHWFSTVFGVYYFAGCVSFIHAFIAFVVIQLHRSGHLRGVVTPEHFHDLGKMMFAFTVFWAYIAFSQYMLIWYASVPEETEWYEYRGQGQFLWLSLVLVFVRFVFPFLGLMSRKIKRNPKTLMFWSVWIMAAELVDMYWLIQPVHAHEKGIYELHLGPSDLLTFLGIGGIVLAVFTWGLCKHALIPVKDPRILESINHENA
jgi:hypothetical protein